MNLLDKEEMELGVVWTGDAQVFTATQFEYIAELEPAVNNLIETLDQATKIIDRLGNLLTEDLGDDLSIV